MSIRATFVSDFKAADLTDMPQDMLAEVVAEYAQERFKDANRSNARLAGGYVPYTVNLSGRVMGHGRGEILPKAPLVAAIKAQRRPPIIDVEWKWESLDGNALDKALAAYVRADATFGRIQTASEFARLVLVGERGELFRFLLMQYARKRYPNLVQGFAGARDLYKVYRRIKIADRILLGGGKSEKSDVAPVLAWIADALRDGSAVLTGAYRDAHELWADGSYLMAAADVSEDADLPDGVTEYAFTNTVPYARKIEFGKTKAGRSFTIEVPNHLYERTAKAARQEFGKLADISFEVREFPSVIVRF